MRRQLRSLYKFLVTFGFDPKKTINSIRGLLYYFNALKILKRQQNSAKRGFSFGKPNLCLEDRFLESGNAKGHYFYQDWLVARRIFLNNPEIHIDVGSRVDGFVTHVASFRSIQVIDIRLLTTNIPNIKFIQADLMSPIRDELTECCDSLSCLHTLEHFGLGRYGDPIQYDGYITGLNNLACLLKQYGKFYISVPIGPQRIEFNAHRVFSIQYLIELFNEKFRVDYFSFVDDNGDLHENAPLTRENITTNFDCTYGCGIFEMTKL